MLLLLWVCFSCLPYLFFLFVFYYYFCCCHLRSIFDTFFFVVWARFIQAIVSFTDRLVTVRLFFCMFVVCCNFMFILYGYWINNTAHCMFYHDRRGCSVHDPKINQKIENVLHKQQKRNSQQKQNSNTMKQSKRIEKEEAKEE